MVFIWVDSWVGSFYLRCFDLENNLVIRSFLEYFRLEGFREFRKRIGKWF